MTITPNVYVTSDDCVARFGAERVAQFFCAQSADGSTDGTVDSTAFLAAATDASAEFDEIVRTTYGASMPFQGPPYDPAIVEIVCIFTMRRGALRRPEYKSVDKNKAGPFQEEYDAAQLRAQEIKRGERRLAVDTLARPANSGGEVVNTNVVGARPFYFTPNPSDPSTGGMFGF